MTALVQRNPAAPGSRCPIVLACDDSYAMPLATTLRSLVESNERHWPLEVTILTDRFAEDARALVSASLPPGSASLDWNVIDLSRLPSPSLLQRSSIEPDDANAEMRYLLERRAAILYARFTIEQVFARDVRRIVYLDADILVLGDLGPLFDIDLGDHVLAAVPDDYIDAAIRSRDPGAPKGLPSVSRYFNAGVLVINMDSWRRNQTARSAIEYMANFPKSPYAEQDALNAACDGRWTVLDGRWNYQRHRMVRISELPSAEAPMVVHFITGKKPWLPSSMSLNAALYDSFRARTAFKRTLPSRIADATATFTCKVLRRIRSVVANNTRA